MTPNWWTYLVDGAVVVGSIGTAGALVVAAFAYRRTVEQHRREQASRVFALPLFSPGSAADRNRWDSFEATITNRSEMPVLDVDIALYDFTGERVAGRHFDMLMPGAESSAIPFPSSLAAPADRDIPLGDIPRLHIAFTDSNGIRWLRKPDGTLTEVEAGAGA